MNYQQKADEYIRRLGLQKHPEGGYYKETYRSNDELASDQLPVRFSPAGNRNFSTAIYYLLRGDDFSAFHKIQSDEMWHFYDGTSIEILMLQNNTLKAVTLGRGIDRGEQLQFVVPSGAWFGARLKDSDGFALAGCTVSPGFDFSDFILADPAELKKQYPAYAGVIEQLAR